MTPSEQAMFNSNREKSPVRKDGASTSADSLMDKSPRILPSTGETGQQHPVEGQENKLTAHPLQKTLPNLYGEYDGVIQ